MQLAAYGAGMTPAEFWESTPYEVGLVIRAANNRWETWQGLLAWHLAPILNMVSKSRVTPQRLLGKPETKENSSGSGNFVKWAFDRWLSDPNIR